MNDLSRRDLDLTYLGKSTLQNEIVGDLTVEFMTLPDGSEEMALEALGKRLEPQFNGQLGKVSSTLIAGFISAHMPARFGLSTAREHIHTKWLLGPSRQTSLLLFAAAAATSSLKGRIAGADAAKNFLDECVQAYATSVGLVLQAQDENAQAFASTSTVVDSSALKALAAKNQTLARKQLNVLAEHLKLDVTNAGHQQETEFASQELQTRLDNLLAEVGEEFAHGIKPRFNPQMKRHFDFAWNQRREDEVRAKYAASRRRLWNNLASSKAMLLPSSSPSSVGSAITTPPNEEAISELTLSGRSLDLRAARPRTVIGNDGSITVQEEHLANNADQRSYSTLIRNGLTKPRSDISSKIQLLSKVDSDWAANVNATQCFHETIEQMQVTVPSYSGLSVLVTGAGKQSIAEEVVRTLLLGGARVIVASSRGPADSADHYRQIYAQSCGDGSSLTVLPFNQASAQDCKELVDYIYAKDGLDRHLDALIPFAALSETGVEVDAIDAKSELAHRLMLTNVLRIIGHIIRNKRAKNIQNRLTQVVLPFSPNHGIFGGDGMYSASKLGLESMLSRAVSETWSDTISVCGTIIGWTRGTGLMQQNDIVAEKIEASGVLTFSQRQMAANIAAVLSPGIAEICEDEPLLADFSGGLAHLPQLKRIFDSAREDTLQAAAIAKAIREEDASEISALSTDDNIIKPAPLTTLTMEFPALPSYEKELVHLSHLQGMVDLSAVVVVVGYSELGPWGNARTRWAMESDGELSSAACIELAWMTNMIKHFDGTDAKGAYVGWIDTKSKERVADHEVKQKYGEHLIENCGIRVIRSADNQGYDPENKESLQEVAIEEDLPEFETDADAAAAFLRRHGEYVVVKAIDRSEQKRVRFKAGARIMIPRASKLETSLVAGQMPSGWNPRVYGISDDIVNQVDPVTLYVLCCVAEAFLSAGITDPMQVYKSIHTSEIGNIIGSSMGGTLKTRNMYRDIYLNKYVQGDVIQETYLNTPSAWVNMLLLGSNGPIKTPVGACATGVEAIDTGFESIVTGKTKMCLVGGTDNFHEDESYGFSTMKATVNTAKEFASGRLPKEMSRPTAETRAGFVESQGCGVQILCNAETAFEMGLPIYAVIAGSSMAADKISRSVPAPGQGVLTFARESETAHESPLLNVQWRKACLQAELSRFTKPNAPPPMKYTPLSDGLLTPPASRTQSGEELHLKTYLPPHCEQTIPTPQLKALKRYWGNEFRQQDTNISPMRASLAVWGLTVDDISVVSMHGTSTKANDKNESQVINTQMRHLRRGSGPLLAICQKSVTGHPKAPAASWMLNGCLQALSTGLVPGNRNADNVDPALQQFEHLVYPTSPIQTAGIDAFLLNSFGFGQKGGQVVGVHPKFVLATLSRTDFGLYAAKNAQRIRWANREFARSIFSNSIVKMVEKPQYAAEDEASVFLDPQARISDDMRFERSSLHDEHGKLKRQNGLQEAMSKAKSAVDASLQCAHSSSLLTHTGIDTEDLLSFTSDANPIFIERNYTLQEQSYARASVNPHATYVSRWCAKEAIFKSLGIASLGAGTPLKDIEVVAEGRRKPEVKVSLASYL